MIGVLLAGGRATRLPNKVLLPTRSGPMAIQALEHMKAAGCTKLVVLDQPCSLLGDVLADHPLEHTTVIDNFSGINNALSNIADMFPTNLRYAVFCADNVYPKNEQAAAKNDTGNYAIVRPIREDLAQGLDFWAGDHWAERKARSTQIGALSLTTPWVFSYANLKLAAEYKSIIEFFNECEVRPIMRGAKGWADLGTPESFAHYWRG